MQQVHSGAVRSAFSETRLKWSDEVCSGPMRSELVPCGLKWSDAVISDTPEIPAL